MNKGMGSHAALSRFSGLRAGAGHDGIDLYVLYEELRTFSPVWQSPWEDWYLTSSQTVERALIDPACNRLIGKAETAPVDQMIANYFGDWVIYVDGPMHRQLRSDMGRAFTAQRTESLRSLIEKTCRSLLSQQSGKSAEIVAGLTRPLPVLVISQLIGTPAGDSPLLRKWAVLLRGVLDGNAPDADQRKALEEMWDYFQRLISDPAWRSGPAGETFGPLLASFPLEVAAANLAFLAFAGHETTVHLMSSLLFLLAARPAIWQELRARPELIPDAVTETLRMESPVQKICRWTNAEVTIGGVDIPSNQLLVAMLGAANRDPALFANPDEFELHRDQRKNVAFGRGVHLCLGRSLALLEATTLLRVLLESWQSVEVGAGGAFWLKNSSFRGLDKLELRWRNRAEPN